MKRAVAITAVGLSMAGCSSMPSMPSLSLGGPSATTVQFESVPPGAEAKTSTGQTCRTPCAQAIAADEFTVTFTLNGYQPQTIPVRIAASLEPIDPNTGRMPAPRLVPNPVYAELQPVPPPPPPRRRTAPKPRQPPVAQQPTRPAPASTAAKPAPAPPAAPAPAPAAAWPPPPATQSAPTAAWPAPPPPR
jgi:hypothetical protein